MTPIFRDRPLKYWGGAKKPLKFSKAYQGVVRLSYEDNAQKMLARIVEPYRISVERQKRGCDVRINYQRVDAAALLRLPIEWRVQPVDELMSNLRETFRMENIQLRYS